MSGLKLDMGLSHTNIHDHSWRPIGPEWVWIAKATKLQGERFPASRADVQRYGHLARYIRRIGPPPPLLKSFVEAVRVEEMARREDKRS